MEKQIDIRQDEYGFDEKGRHYYKTEDGQYKKYASGRYDKYGFDVNGIHKITQTQFDENGFNRNGIHKDTGKEVDSYGFKRDGNYYELQEDGVYQNKGETDPDGYNFQGLDEHYFGRTGFYMNQEGELYNPKGFKQDGTYGETGLKYDKFKFTIDGINVVTGTEVDIRGFTRKGRHRTEGFLCYRKGKLSYSRRVEIITFRDEWGFLQDGTYEKTGEKYHEGYNCFGVDKNGKMRNGQIHPDIKYAIAYIKGIQSTQQGNAYAKFAKQYIESKLKHNIPGVTAEDYIRIILEAAGQMYPEIKTTIILSIRKLKSEISSIKEESQKQQLTEKLQRLKDIIEYR